jgi:hypothetical protein
MAGGGGEVEAADGSPDGTAGIVFTGLEGSLGLEGWLDVELGLDVLDTKPLGVVDTERGAWGFCSLTAGGSGETTGSVIATDVGGAGCEASRATVGAGASWLEGNNVGATAVLPENGAGFSIGAGCCKNTKLMMSRLIPRQTVIVMISGPQPPRIDVVFFPAASLAVGSAARTSEGAA